MQALFTLCSTVYLLIYAFEGAIRYGLYIDRQGQPDPGCAMR